MAQPAPPPQPAPAAAKKNFLLSRTFIGISAALLGFLIGNAGGSASAPEAVPAITTTVTATQQATVNATVTSTVTATAVTTAVSTQFITVTASPPPVPVFTVVPGQYRDLSDRDFKLIAKDPDAYAGDQVTIYGEVFQFDSATGATALLANAGGEKVQVEYGFTDYDQNSMISGTEEMLGEVVEGDVFEAQVNVLGSYSYDTQIGGNTTVPHFEVVSITVYDSVD